MKGDRLEADEVISAGDTARDGRCPSAVLVDHFSGAPVAVTDRAAEEARFVDFELDIGRGGRLIRGTWGNGARAHYPGEAFSIDTSARPRAARGQVCQL